MARKEMLVRKRKDRGFTQDQAAFFVGVSRSTYANWEQGRNQPDKRSRRALDKIFPGWGG